MKPDQMMTMVTKLKATDMKEPDGVEACLFYATFTRTGHLWTIEYIF
jgi:hypothetical protein